MKIFGNTSVQGRISADTGSFKIYGITAGETIPSVFVAGTDTPDYKSIPKNRSIVAHGQYDYIISSQNSGLSFDQAFLQAGNVMGFRVQHVKTSLNEDKIYALRTNTLGNRALAASSINVSLDGGVTFIGDVSLGAYALSSKIVAFDMIWLNEDEAFVVGGTPGTTNGTSIQWRKFSRYGLQCTTAAGNPAEQYPIIFKKEKGSSQFVEWGTAPTDRNEDAATAIAVKPDNPSIVIIGTQLGRIYKSTDGALTWTYVGSIGSLGTCVNRIKFATGDSNTVYAVGEYAALYKSTAAGNSGTWTPVSIENADGPLVVLTRDARVPAFNDILVPNTTDVIVVGDDHTRVLKSSNSGVTWKYVSSGIYSDYLPIENIKTIRVGLTNYYLAISRNKLFVSLNPDIFGSDNPSTIDWVEHTLAVDAIDLQVIEDENPILNDRAGYAFILTKTGIYEYWIQNNKLSIHKEFTSVVNEIPTKLVAHSYREHYITTANAKIIRATKYNYNLEDNFVFTEETSSLTSQDLIALSTARSGRIFAGSNTGKIIFKDTGSIIDDTTYSTDPVTWSEVGSAPTASSHRVLQLQALDNTKLYALIEDTGSLQHVLFNSFDSGSTWNRLYTYPEGIKKFIAYDTASIYAMNQRGTAFYYTTSSFSEIVNSVFDNTTGSLADVFEIDAARSTTQNDIIFLIGGAFGIRATNLKLLFSVMGPWQDNSWTLCAIAGDDGYNYWIGGGTTFGAARGKGLNLGSEPILLTSPDGGESWQNAISRIANQEPADTGASGGDFTFTSISEGQYYILENKDVFNIYGSSNEGTTFERANSNLYREDLKYPGNLDGIKKIRFYDSKFGVAVSDITQQQITNGSKISITKDGGTTWNFYESDELEGFNFNSVFITRQLADGEYEIYVTAYPKDSSAGDGYIFKSTKSGNTGTFKTVYSFTNGTTSGATYQPKDIYFSNPLTGSVTIKGAINGSPAIEGLYRTADGGTTWNLITITDFAAGDTNGHLQFVTSRKGFVAGTYGSSKNAGLFKTTDAGESWTRIITPYDTTANKAITGMHFLTEGVGIISMGSEIFRTGDSGSNWTKVHDLQYDGTINEIKFTGNGQLGFAVGHYNATNSTTGEHFVLKSVNSGSSWSLIDSRHDYVDLEFEFDSLRNLIGQPSTLHTVAFAEKIILAEESKSVDTGGPDPGDPQPLDCFGAPFMSASYYNFENFAYRCTPSGSIPRFYPNSSNNIGLGKGIFGQNSTVELTKLRYRVSYGAALGVGALGKAEYSTGDTATGFGAMDMIKNAKNNVAIGYKALSSNTADNSTTLKNTAVNLFATSSLLGLSNYGELLMSENVGDSWVTITNVLETGSYNTASFSGSLEPIKIYKASDTQAFVLNSDLSGSANTKTFIANYNTINKKYKAVYSSSIYTIHSLSVLTPSLIFGIDTGSGVFLKSTNGAKTFSTGSILNTSGNELKSLKMYSDGLGFIVGSEIWKLQSGSKTNWETSSYSGSHVLNAIDYISSNTWVAVGTSGSIYRSSNKGLNWNLISTGLTSNDYLDVRAAGSKIVAVGISGSIAVSSNSGITWKSGSFITSGSSYGSINEVVLVSNTTIVARHQDGLIKSIDGGKTWYDTGEIANTTAFGGGGTPEFQIKSIALTKYSNETPSKNPQYDLSLDKSLTENPSQQLTVPQDIVDENVAVGSYALSSFENSSRMVAVGANSLRNVQTDIGKRGIPSVYEDVFKGIYFGDLINGPESLDSAIPKLPSNYGQVAIGAYSQYNSSNASYNSSVGYGTLYDSINSSNNTAVGFYSQHLGQNHRNTSLGVWALGLNGDLTRYAQTASVSLNGGSDNIAIGYKALLNNIGSVRAKQILQAGYVEPYRAFYSFSSRNIAIGNFALINASGSSNTIAIGYRALAERGFDLTDSVFIGNYVGENFQTKIGTFYSGSSTNENDWKFTQTVAVGSRTLQNHIGYDIVAIGANALRGSETGGNAAIPDVTVTTEPIGALLLGFFNSHIIGRTNFSDLTDSKLWSTSNYVKKRTDSYFIYDELTAAGKKWNPRYSDSVPRSIAIASRTTAYAVIEQKTTNGAKYPLIVKTNKLSDATGKGPIEWNVVQPGLLKDLGTINLRLDTPDEDTMYLASTKPYKSSTGNRRGSIYKATSTNGFEGAPISFTSILDENNDYGIVDMHFPSVDNGAAVVGQRGVFITNNGGASWTMTTNIDNSTSGSNVRLGCVWINNSGSVAYAAGNYGSIYKWTSESGSWVKQLGASGLTKFGGNFWDAANLLMRPTNAQTASLSVPAFFADKSNEGQKFFDFFDIQFLNDSFGFAIGMRPEGLTSPPIPLGAFEPKLFIAKTIDGGATWVYKDVILPRKCGQAASIGNDFPQPYGELTIIDQNKAIIGMSYGQIAYTTDGGETWQFTDSHYGASFSTTQGCGCDPFPVTHCSDYKFFEGATITVSGSEYQDIIQVVTVGSEAQPKLTAVNDNVAIGYKVQFNGTGSAVDSVQIGASATIQANTISDTVSIGNESLYRIKYSDKNTAVGKKSLDSLLQPNSQARTYPGPIGGTDPEFNALTDSSNNTAVGYNAGTTLIAGDKNVFIGVNSGQALNGGANLKTWGSNNVVIGADSPKTVFNIMNQVALGNQLINTHVAWGVPGVAGWIWQSDARDKTETSSFSLGLDFIRQIQPKQFKWDGRFNYVSGSPNGTYKQSGSSYGYIAQDLEVAANAVGVSSSMFIVGASGSYSGSVSETGSFDIKLIKPAMVNLVAINAIKQLDTTVTYLSSSKYTTNLGDGSNVSYPVTHSLGTRDVIAMVYSNNSNLVVYPTMSINSTDTMTIVFNSVPTSSEYRLVVMR